MLRNSASGPEVGFQDRILSDCYLETTEIGPPPAEGRPEGRFLFFPGSSPAKFRPGSLISGPEALLRNFRAAGGIAALRCPCAPPALLCNR
jgi:hypothetical protein